MDYETLRIIWWVLIGVLLIGFAITDGFDLGVGALLRIIGHTDSERRVMINTIGPHWDGNQVWFITAGGALFAAYPLIYAASFSGFYFALLITLAALWMRPVGFDYRSKIDSQRWRNNWDWAIFASGIVPSLIFGVALGNLFLGVPLNYDVMLRPSYDGGLFGLLRPFALLAGLVSVSMLLMHGAVWLQMKTDGFIYRRSVNTAVILGIATTVMFGVAGIWVGQLDGYHLSSVMDHNGPSNPLNKTVELVEGGWLSNYHEYPLMVLAPILGLVSPLLVAFLSVKGRAGWAFTASSLAISGIILTTGFSLFPFLMPSSTQLNASLTVWDATSSETTLMIMFGVACVFVPLILLYTAWGYWVMRGRVTEKDIAADSHQLY
ncbi:MAG: cytochrome d ubiquinol oxidase subunit II [Paraglaciecola sp.]|uniref:cytochrome d ubiquinol oxidase subunit II n=1 Tax=Paraglaciecola sp. TaxID=1920173 RepID=UPI00273F1E0C|nr:cytochrome d ubiquinol oxidase subunit II [Paraglaciecola sp.]MDP5031585.1 cytochrome d ubiquinol oxidase subunit II [Paraglaciecola sp.]MDP5133343.1 cytochrome d ubiquinol oxidase subunit II [Paraglaciecola sp.]